jgi:hypothetical protein
MCGIACNEGEMLLGIGGMPVLGAHVHSRSSRLFSELTFILGAHAPSYMMSPLRGSWAEGAGACSGLMFILRAHVYSRGSRPELYDVTPSGLSGSSIFEP